MSRKRVNTNARPPEPRKAKPLRELRCGCVEQNHLRTGVSIGTIKYCDRHRPKRAGQARVSE